LEIAAALDLRERVFSGEQGVSIAADRDGRDGESTHLVAVERDLVIGTCRLLFRGNVARLGRLAVDPDRRGEGIAAALLALADRVALDQGADAISLHAQTYARRLYLDAGYEERGPKFVEEGIEHVAMGKRIDPSRARP
jgi:predicted GNAT family N-acyltransferase